MYRILPVLSAVMFLTLFAASLSFSVVNSRLSGSGEITLFEMLSPVPVVSSGW